MNINPKPDMRSVPTMCLGCHMIVELISGETAWHCPNCTHRYEFKFWKIRTAKKLRERQEKGTAA